MFELSGPYRSAGLLNFLFSGMRHYILNIAWEAYRAASLLLTDSADADILDYGGEFLSEKNDK